MIWVTLGFGIGMLLTPIKIRPPVLTFHMLILIGRQPLILRLFMILMVLTGFICRLRVSLVRLGLSLREIQRLVYFTTTWCTEVGGTLIIIGRAASSLGMVQRGMMHSMMKLVLTRMTLDLAA